MKIPRFINQLFVCAHCGKGRPQFNRWWFVDVDTTLYCSHCKVRLVRINLLGTAILWAWATAMLYLLFQQKGMIYTIDQTKNIVKIYVVIFFLLIALLRLVLVYLLWIIKNLPQVKKIKY